MSSLSKLEELIRDLYESKDPNRADWSDWLYKTHVFAVADYAKQLAERFGGDAALAAAGGMLHDIADAKMSRFVENHDQQSESIARSLLIEAGFNESEIKIVVEDAMRFHACVDNKLPRTLEGKIVATADAMAHILTAFIPEAVEMQKARHMPAADAAAWARKKVIRDYEEKILFDEIKQEIKPQYEQLLEELQVK